MKQYKRVYAAIHMDAFEHNLKSIKQCIQPGVQIIAVIKMDAYGHGAVKFAEMMDTYEYVWGYAVATLDEAIILRNNGIKKNILVLGYTFPEQYEDLIRYQVRPTIYSMDMAKEFSEVAEKLNQSIPVHIKIDTGMSRLGYQVCQESADEIAQISKLPHMLIEGIFTHFSRADETDKTFTELQLASFDEMIQLLKERQIHIPIHHVSNSAAIIDLKSANLSMVRAGIILYGLWPSDEVKKDNICLRPVMELKSHVIHVKTLQPGRVVSYGGTYEVKEPKVIATIPVGYGDGYARSLSNKGYVLIHGKKAPICGRVCMDQFMVDVTEIEDVKVGDLVTLLGQDQDEEITMEQLGEVSGRFNYEFACDLGKRIPRVYYYQGHVIGSKDYFEE